MSFPIGRSPRARTERAFERLASGKRINKAKDDPAGLAVAEALASLSQSNRQAARNVNDGVSVLQTADGATGQAQDLVKRMRELAIQSSSETLGDSGRGAIQKEFEQLSEELDRISATTEFNGVKLADGSKNSLNVQAGEGDTADDQVGVGLGDLRAASLGVDSASVDLSTADGAFAAISAFDGALESLSEQRSTYGAAQNRLASSLSNLDTQYEAQVAATSRIADADFGLQTAELASARLLEDAAISVQSHRNLSRKSALSLIGG